MKNIMSPTVFTIGNILAKITFVATMIRFKKFLLRFALWILSERRRVAV